MCLKNWLVCLVLSVQSFVLYGQLIWTNVYSTPKSIATLSDNSNRSMAFDGCLFGDSLYARCGEVSQYSCPGKILQVFSQDGTLQWERTGGYNYLKNWDNTLFSVGIDERTDDIFGDEVIQVSRYRTDGSEIFNLTTRLQGYSFDNKIFVHRYDSFISIFRARNFYLITEQGKFISSGTLALADDLFGVELFQDTMFIGATSKQLYIINLKFQIIDSFQWPIDLIDMVVIDNKLWLLSKDSIYVTSSIFDKPLSKFGAQFEFKEIYQDNNGVINIIDSDRTKTRFIRIQNNQIKVSETHGSLMSVINKFEYHKNRIWVTGTSFNQEISTVVIDTSYDQFDDLPDIALQDIKFRHYSGTFWKFSWIADLTIQNLGKDTIWKFSILSKPHNGYNCYRYHNQFFVNDTFIAPMSKITISRTLTVYENLVWNLPKELCLSLLSVNGGPERQTMNNTLCQEIIFVGLPDIKSDYYEVYPNPTTNFLYIDLDQEGELMVSMYNIQDELYLQTIVSNGNEKLDLSGLPRGAYILRISTPKQVFYKRILLID